MIARNIALVSLLVGLVNATDVILFNNCATTIDPAFFPAVSRNGASTGGFSLGPKARTTITFPPKYSGRIWGRTGCDSAGVCRTGQCPGGKSCKGPSSAGATLAQFTLNGYAGQDYYTPTIAEGFNMILTITPGTGCQNGAVRCGTNGSGSGCGSTNSCPTGVTDYVLAFC